MNNHLVYVGSFDPPHIGHFDIIKRGNKLGKLSIGIGINPEKKYTYSLNTRIEILEKYITINKLDIEVYSYSGSTIEFMKQINANMLVRSLRNTSDLIFEYPYSSLNLDYGFETIFLLSRPEYSHISSTLVKEVIKNNLPLLYILDYPKEWLNSNQ